jgi:serine/threonine protein phosphatase 1
VSSGLSAKLPFAKSGAAPRGASGKRCYVIGDVHGRNDLLQQLVDLIDQHNATRPKRDTSIVLLGDLIDRGADSCGVLEFVRAFHSRYARLFVIAGNHEELLLRSLDGDAPALRAWMQNGGDATCRSYGIDPEDLEVMQPDKAAERLRSAIPRSHVALMKSASDSIGFGDFLLAHAGVRPGTPISSQTAQDLRWIRGPFLNSSQDFGCVVIHGHSSSLQIERKRNRIGIDTGAYRTGVLTAAWIEEEELGFLQATGVPDGSWEIAT